MDPPQKRGDSPRAVPSPHFRWATGIIVAVLLFAGLLIVYWPAIAGGFIWDDDSYVTGNMLLRSLEGLSKIWFEPAASPQYYPMVFTSFWLEYRLWELHPLGYHLVNVVLHGLNGLLLWAILRRLSIPGGWLAAALFAFHPVHVESVAWITERKNVLSGLFYLAALWTYLSISLDGQRLWQGRRWWCRYGLSLGLYLAALLSKSVTCSLPAVILLVLWWKRSAPLKDVHSVGFRRTVHDAIALLPMFAVGLLTGLHTVYQEKFHVGAIGPEWDLSIMERFLLAGRISCFYAAKLVAPLRLTFVYPRWTIDAAIWWQYLFPLGVVLATAALWGMRRRIGKAPLVAVLFFLGSLTPALGFFNVFPMRFSYVADHFQYLASIGPITLAAVILERWLGGRALLTGKADTDRPMTPIGGALLRSLPSVAIVPLALLTWRQTHTYVDIETLWRDTIAKNPSAWIAHNNLAHELINRSKYAEAVPHLRKALELNPDYPESLFSLCGALTELSPTDPLHLDEAIETCRKGLTVRPDTALGHKNLCRALSKRGFHEEAIAQGEAAVRLRPDWAPAHMVLGLAYMQVGDLERSLAYVNNAVQLAPGDPQSRVNLAVLLYQLGDVDGAINQLTAALQIRPDLENAKIMLATLLARQQPAP